MQRTHSRIHTFENTFKIKALKIFAFWLRQTQVNSEREKMIKK